MVMIYKFISIEGNIGAGKTTLASLLAEEYHGQLILEAFEDNPTPESKLVLQKLLLQVCKLQNYINA